MEIEAFVQKKKEIYSTLLNFIDAPNDYQEEFNLLIQVFENHNILQNRDETFDLFHLISKLEENHHRTANFYDKFELIFNYIINENKFTISNAELFQIYKNSKRMLLLLLEKNFLIPDESIIKQILQMRDLNGYRYSVYLYSILKPYFNDEQEKSLEKKIAPYIIDIDDFAKKCQIGENDSELCSIIRQDSLEEFKTYITDNKIPINFEIERSIFESNFFLTSIDEKPSLIEYATFYGSIQIIRFLKENDAELKGKLWYFAVHSNNSEVIQFCEENQLDAKVNDYEELIKYSRWYVPEYRSEHTEKMRLLRETVKCHHNDIYNSIKRIFISQNSEENFDEFIKSYIVDLYDYYFYPDDICELITKKKDYHGCNISFLCSKSISKITIPSSVTKIGNGAFLSCSFVNEIEIPSSVIKISNNAFAECCSLLEIVLPSSVTKIGNKAFQNCKKLTKIEIPSSVTKMGDNVFEGCSSLIEVEIPLSITNLGKSVFYGCSNLSRIEIPPSVVSIGDFCFKKCSSLKEVEICPSLVSIGKNCFEDCCSLIQIVIPSSLERINEFTFMNCSSLKKIEFELPSSVSEIGEFAFYKSGLEKASIPQSVTIIGKSAFADCKSLKVIKVPSTVTYIGVDAFSLGTKVI